MYPWFLRFFANGTPNSWNVIPELLNNNSRWDGWPDTPTSN